VSAALGNNVFAFWALSTFRFWTSKMKLFVREAEETDFVSYLREANRRLAYSASIHHIYMSVSLYQNYFV
jgi:hypothetical protein